MTINTTMLTRVAGLAAVVSGLLFIGVQINHPPVDLALVSTTEWTIRQSMKIAMSILAVLGITGMYLSQVKKNGVLGLVGYLILGAAYVFMLSVEVAGLVVLPAIAHSAPGYVSDVLAVATNGVPTGDIGLLKPLNLLVGLGYMAGGLVFGIALFRAKVLARWSAILLAVGTISSLAIPLLPWINQRLFAVPTGVAFIGLGYSLWLQHRSQTASATETAAPLKHAAVQ